MEELYALALMSASGFPMGDAYDQALHDFFLRDGSDEVLLDLEYESDRKAAILRLLARPPKSETEQDAMGRYLMEKLRPFYRTESLADFTRKLYRMWKILPFELATKDPFHIMCYADDPLAWNQTDLCRSLCETMLDFYLPYSDSP